MPRPLIATIDIAAMRHNLRVAKRAAPQGNVWAIVKANAYGHGLERALRGFAEADGLGLLEPQAALLCRELGWRKPILLLEGVFDAADVALCVAQQIQTVVHCSQQIALLAAAPAGAKIDVYLKLNSGMNRLGFPPAEYRAAYARLRAMSQIGQISLMTHFANADQPNHAVLPLAQQMRCFDDASAGISAARSVANSATILLHPQLANDWLRPGIMLYGATPGGGSAADFGLLPVMSLNSELICVQTLAAGDAVGYGSSFTASEAMRIGVVACGYADGYPRHAPSGTPVLVDGVRSTLVGRVSMDMLTVDLRPVPKAQVGSKVSLWGDGLPIDDVAEAAGTIGYELMCALAPRVPVQER